MTTATTATPNRSTQPISSPPQSELPTATTATPNRPTEPSPNTQADSPPRQLTTTGTPTQPERRNPNERARPTKEGLRDQAATWLALALNHEESAILSDRLIDRARHSGEATAYRQAATSLTASFDL